MIETRITRLKWGVWTGSRWKNTWFSDVIECEVSNYTERIYCLPKSRFAIREKDPRKIRFYSIYEDLIWNCQKHDDILRIRLVPVFIIALLLQHYWHKNKQTTKWPQMSQWCIQLRAKKKRRIAKCYLKYLSICKN